MDSAAVKLSSPVSEQIQPLPDHPEAVEWELDVGALRSGERRCVFVVQCPCGGKTPRTLQLALHARWGRGNRVTVFVQAPAGVRLSWQQWIGPHDRTSARREAHWKDTEWKSSQLSSWPLLNHANCGKVLLGFAALLTEPDGGLTALPHALGRYAFHEKVGEGSSGCIYAVEQPAPHSDTAEKIKAEPVQLVAKRQTASFLLLREASVMHELSDRHGFPEFFGLFQETDGTDHALVMERLHLSLLDLGSLDTLGVINVGLQCIDRLQEMHKMGFLHRDLKPANIMVNADQSVVHLIDFGLSTRFRMAGHRFDRDVHSICGTVNYMAMSAHKGQHSPFSDLESLTHVLAFMAVGSLPWQDVRAPTKAQRDSAVLHMKSGPALQRHLFHGLESAPQLAGALVEMVRHCRAAAVQDEPDYDALRAILAAAREPAKEGVQYCKPIETPLARGLPSMLTGLAGLALEVAVTWCSPSSDAKRTRPCGRLFL